MLADKIQYYADYYALTAESGLNSSKNIFDAISIAKSIRLSTIPIPLDAVVAHNQLVSNLESTYEIIFTSAFSLEPMDQAFNALSSYIKKYASTVDEFLSDNNIDVDETYAQLSRLYGHPVSEENIR